MVARREDDAPLARLGRLLWREGALTALVVIALVGIGISIYLTTVHYAHVPLFCAVNSLINCAAVTTSAYSVVPGTQIPITIPGILWFVVSGALAVVALRAVWRGEAEPAWLRRAHFAWAVAGMAFVLYLVVVELDILHQICEWCTGVHVLTALTFLIVLLRLLEARGAQLANASALPASPATSVRASTTREPERTPARSSPGSRVSSAATARSATAAPTRAAQPVGAGARRTGAGSSSGSSKRRSGSHGRRRR